MINLIKFDQFIDSVDIEGNYFWERKITDSDLLKQTQSIYSIKFPTHPRIIFYESMSGARMMGNPFAIFKKSLQDDRLKDFLHVWSVRSRSLMPAAFKNMENVIFVERNTQAYIYFLMRAKYIISNSVMPEYFVRKQDQKYLNTWHGIPYKLIGRSEKSTLGSVNSVYSMLQATHVVSPCEYMTNVYLKNFSMKGAFAGELLQAGYPRVDTTLEAIDFKRDSLRQSLGLIEGKKVILYAPTWRGEKGNTAFDVQRLVADLHKLSTLDAEIVFLGHHLMLRHVAEVEFERIIIPPDDTNTNDLLAIVDLLITDYSSIFFDFLITRRPIVHYLYDIDEYERERGLGLDISDLPGEIAYDSNDLISLVDQLFKKKFEPNETYLKAIETFCPYEDGKSSERVIDWYFFGLCRDYVVYPNETYSKKILFWGGHLNDPEKIDSYFRTIREKTNDPDNEVILFVSRSVKKSTLIMDELRKLGNKISLVTRTNYEMAMTPDEKIAREKINKKNYDPSEIRQLYHNMYLREYRRIFGDAKFDEVIRFEKLSYFWEELMKFAYI